MLVVVMLVLTACGTVQHKHTMNADLNDNRPFLISTISVEDATGFEFPPEAESIDLKETLHSSLEEELRKEKMFSVSGQDGYIELSAKIIEYAPGSAGKRWLLPGYGSTVLSTYSELKDLDSGVLLSTVEARRTVEAGGLYTVGAWRQSSRTWPRIS